MKRLREEAVRRLAKAAGVDEQRIASLLQPADPEHGEFALPCFVFAKERRTAPPKIAAEVAAAFEAGGGIASAEAVGPYVNLRADLPALARETLDEVAAAGDRYGHSASGRGKTVVVDFSAPNIAKPLAFHHLRSTMIGNSLCRLYRAGGWTVVGINHLGDWGTGFGKLLLAHERHGKDLDLETCGPEDLNELYVRINQEIEAERKAGGRTLEEAARARFLALERGDPEARRLWRRFVEVSMREYEAVYRRLDVRFDHFWGESFYEDKMPAVLDELKSKGLLVPSEGAEVVMLEEEGMPPCLIRKSDGATLYATRDLAAAIYRHDRFGFDRALYVTDKGQALHFRQWVRVLEKAGHPWARTIRHVPFGVVRMGGKKTATRKGSVVLLLDVLDAAVEKVKALIAEKNPDLANADDVAREVGVGAVVFNDLKNHRENDVDFDLDAITSFDGKTGPYVMYSHARACSILDRAGEPVETAADATLLRDPSEALLLRLIAEFPERVDAAREKDEPSEVARHLLDLCEAFHAYHTKGGRDRSLRVLAEDPALRAARLRLTDAVRQVLRNSLTLLGIAAPRAM